MLKLVKSDNPSLLRDYLPPRALPLVLGRMMANTPLGRQERHALLGRLYSRLRPLDKIICRNEMVQCRRAKRGQLEATVP